MVQAVRSPLKGCIVSFGNFTLLTQLGGSDPATGSLTGREDGDGGDEDVLTRG